MDVSPLTTMQAPLHWPNVAIAPSSIVQVADHILSSRRITRVDQHHFMAVALAKPALSGDEQLLVNRVFELLKRGLLKVVD